MPSTPSTEPSGTLASAVAETASAAAVYQRRAAAALASIEAAVDRWLEDDVVDIDAARTGGLLELGFPDGSKIVVNTQPPLEELWLAARGGGWHFKHREGRWVDRDGHEFFVLLSAQASAQSGRTLAFEPPPSVG